MDDIKLKIRWGTELCIVWLYRFSQRCRDIYIEFRANGDEIVLCLFDKESDQTLQFIIFDFTTGDRTGHMVEHFNKNNLRMIICMFHGVFIYNNLRKSGTCESCGRVLFENITLNTIIKPDFDYDSLLEVSCNPCILSKCTNERCKTIEEIQASEDQEGFVYGYYAPEINMIKIGKGVNIDARKQYSANQSPTPISLYFKGKGYTRTEKWLHEKFKAHRRNGEWFIFDDEIKNFLSEKSQLFELVEQEA